MVFSSRFYFKVIFLNKNNYPITVKFAGIRVNILLLIDRGFIQLNC